jgi:hypothetical protein
LQSYKLNAKNNLSASDLTALAEILKFLYNLTFHSKVAKNTGTAYHISECPTNISLASQLIQLLVSFRATGFQPPLTNIVHCLLNLPLANSQLDLFPNSSSTKVVRQIIDLLDRSIPQDTESVSDNSLDENLSPIIGLLSSIREVAPESVKTYMKQRLLPSETYFHTLLSPANSSDRNLPVGQSQSVSSRLLRLVTNAFTPTLRETIYSLIFQLVDSSPVALVDAIGYGYAAGYLFSHNMPIPPNLQNPVARGDINPVTGQRLDAEPMPNLVEMTDEEKEREAEKLFVLFERMRKLGMGVENPVRTAQQSGKFEELD